MRVGAGGTGALALLVAVLAGCGGDRGGDTPAKGDTTAVADTAAAHGVVVERPWVRTPIMPPAGPGPPPPVNTAAYLVLTNRTDSTETLVGVATGAADTAEIHSATMDGDIMRMRPVGSVVVPPGGRVVLAPGGLHIMLIGLHRRLAEGDSVALQLRLHGGRVIDVMAPVRRSPPPR